MYSVGKSTGYSKENIANMITMMHLRTVYPSSAMHAPLCDYESIPIEYVRCHRNTVSERGKFSIGMQDDLG